MTTPAPPRAITEQFEHERRAVQIDLEDRLRRRLAGRDASGVDQPGNITQARRLFDQRLDRDARGDIDRRNARFIPRRAEHFGGGLGVVLPHVGHDDPFAYADAARDGLADLSGADDDDDFRHGSVLS